MRHLHLIAQVWKLMFTFNIPEAAKSSRIEAEVIRATFYNNLVSLARLSQQAVTTFIVIQLHNNSNGSQLSSCSKLFKWWTVKEVAQMRLAQAADNHQAGMSWAEKLASALFFFLNRVSKKAVQNSQQAVLKDIEPRKIVSEAPSRVVFVETSIMGTVCSAFQNWCFKCSGTRNSTRKPVFCLLFWLKLIPWYF